MLLCMGRKNIHVYIRNQLVAQQITRRLYWPVRESQLILILDVENWKFQIKQIEKGALFFFFTVMIIS